MSGAIGFASLLTNIGIARYLGPQGRGLLAMIMTPYGIALSAATGGLAVASANLFVRKGAARGPVLTAATLVALGSSTAVGIVWLLSAALAGLFDTAPGVALGTGVAVILLPITVTWVCGVEVSKQNGAGRDFDFLRGFPAFFSGALVLAVLALGDAASPGLAVALCALALVLPPALVGVTTLIRARLGAHESLGLAWIRPMVRFARPAWASAVTDALLMRVDQLVLIVFVTEEQLGIYAVAATVASSAGLVRSAVTSAYFRALHEARENELRPLSSTLLQTTLAACLVAYLLVLGLSWLFLPAILGPGFAGVVPLIALLLVAQMGLDIQLAAGSVLYVLERPGLVSASSLVGLGVNATLLAALVATTGVIGAAVASVVAYWASGLFAYRAMRIRVGR